MSKGVDELRRLHRTLGVLLDDPQPGLLTWKKMLSEVLLDMACYAGVGMAPKHAAALLEALEFIVNDVPKPGEDAELTATGYNMACAAIALATAPASALASAGTTTSG